MYAHDLNFYDFVTVYGRGPQEVHLSASIQSTEKGIFRAYPKRKGLARFNGFHFPHRLCRDAGAAFIAVLHCRHEAELRFFPP